MQGATLLALVVVDYRRKKLRKPATFPRLPPRSVTVGSSEVTVYTYGEDLYRDMLNAISQAKSRIFFESFIWKGDAIGQAFKDALIDAANRGVKVYVVFDEFANLVVPRSFFVFPKNIAVRRHPLIASGFRFPRNTGRDHRKLLVVDDLVAFLGGYNIGSLYATDWRDTHARLTGDIVWDVQNAFIDFWNLWSGRRRAALPDFGSADLAARHSDPSEHAAQHGLSDSRHVSECHRPRVPPRLSDPRLLHPRHRTSCPPSSEPHVEVLTYGSSFPRSPTTSWLTGCPAASTATCSATAYGCCCIRAPWCTPRPPPSTANGRRSARQTSTGLSLLGNYEINMEVFNTDVARQMEEIFDDRLHQYRRADAGRLAAPARHGEVLRDRADPAAPPPLSRRSHSPRPGPSRKPSKGDARSRDTSLPAERYWRQFLTGSSAGPH